MSSTCCWRFTAPGKTTLVLVTHDPEIAAIADVSIALRDGRVVQVTDKTAELPLTGTDDSD